MAGNRLKWEEKWALPLSLRKRLSFFFKEEGIPIKSESLDKLVEFIEDEIDKRVFRSLVVMSYKGEK